MKNPSKEEIKEFLKSNSTSQAKAAVIAGFSKSKMERICRGDSELHLWIWERLQKEIKSKANKGQTTK